MTATGQRDCSLCPVFVSHCVFENCKNIRFIAQDFVQLYFYDGITAWKNCLYPWNLHGFKEKQLLLNKMKCVYVK